MSAVIEIENLRMRYGNSLDEVLKGVNLKIEPGEIIGYIGPNGAGKSTTLKIMLGMIKDYDGSVKLFGQDIKEDPLSYKSRIGYV